jgi:hypothetical protein
MTLLGNKNKLTDFISTQKTAIARFLLASRHSSYCDDNETEQYLTV